MKKMTRSIAKMLSMLLVAGFALCVNTVDVAKAEKTYLVVADNSFAPFDFLDASTNTYTGVDMDLLAAIAADQGFKYEVDNCGWNAALGNLNSGQADGMIAGMTITPDREKSYDFSTPYFEDGQTLFVAKNSKLASLEDLKGKIVAVKTGTQGAKYVESIKDQYGFTVQSFEGSDAVYAAVQTGNVDAGVEDYSVISYRISTANLPLMLFGEKVNVGPYGFAVMKGKNAELIEMFNKGLANIKENGTYAKVLAKYGM